MAVPAMRGHRWPRGTTWSSLGASGKGTMETVVNEEIWVILDSRGTELAESTLKGLQNEGI